MVTKKTDPKQIVPEVEQIDVRAGACTYGQMVTLGRILDAAIAEGDAGGDKSVEVMRSLIVTLHPDVEPTISITNARYARNIAAAVRHWREQENDKLKYTPTVEEKAAGYDVLAKVTGPTGIASTLAEKFGVAGKPGDRVGPDVVFEWPYATVFMILYIDSERYKFQKRLQDIRENKRKRDEKNRRWSRKQ